MIAGAHSRLRAPIATAPAFRPLFRDVDSSVIEMRGPLGACRPARGLPRPALRRRARHPTRLHALQTDHGDRHHERQPARSRARLPPLPDAGQDLGHADQADGQPARPRRWPIRPASPTPAWRSSTTRARPATCTARGNLVAVITNGTAVLGLGNIGPLAGKPVMEGKGCLFKKFAGIDVFDIELAENDPDKLIETIAALEPTFGGINLEDIKAPECFYIETQAARAHEDPGLPRRPARHRHHRGGGDPQRAEASSARTSPRSSWWPRARAPRRSPAWTCW